MTEKRTILLLCATVAVLYGTTLTNEFARDDFYYIVRNAQVRHAPWRQLIEPHQNSNVYRPLVFLSYSLNYFTLGMHPAGFHLLNLALHAWVTVMLFFLLKELLGERLIALVAAWLFAVHPIHTEAVTNVAGRPELMAAGFLLAAWLAHLRGREVAALALFLMAMMSKESAVVLPAMLVIGDYASSRWKPPARYVRMLALAAAYVGWLWYMQGGRLGRQLIPMIDNPLAGMPAPWRILNALSVAWKYVGLQIYPATLSADYSFNAIPVSRSWVVLLPALLGTLLIAWLWIGAVLRRQGVPIVAGGIYFVAFATTANILIPTGTIMGERLAYLPSAGLCLLAAWIWSRLPLRRRTSALGLLVLIVGAFAMRTVFRNANWRDDLTISQATVEAAPDSVKARNNLGGQYMDRRQPDMAREQYEAGFRIDPDDPDLLASYGLLEYRSGNKLEGERMMERALGMSGRDNPNYDLIATNYAALLVEGGRPGEALAILDGVIAASPNYARALANRAVIHYKQGQREAARADAESALLVDANNSQAQTVLRLLR